MYEHTARCDRCQVAETWTDGQEKACRIPAGFAKIRITHTNPKTYADPVREFLLCRPCQEHFKIARPDTEKQPSNRTIEERLLEIATELIDHVTGRDY